ncbi:uncharacterized protein PHACADRAFT_163896 [Phanerochaete carnosa HHB-10118-sp]|uniref:Uncharacterized protein n=1 Tax=Phanerochaete carnosa (strain HHB-10118-sp) TaxID=650164 RepID=K5VQ27_PHACS|nr:uncharacterized protein PHACADRAFT_163896 [Phanerochaete carnosa HHB-10118-sp]EKM53588.1 hypothetical protein PHACADRAFT_163896 [Phanerochaete carnosa HHB-10118-sp]
MSTINYARLEGIQKSELPGAIIMAAVYLPLFIFNVIRSIRHPTYVLVVLSFFCIVRVTAFTLRAILAGSDNAGENVSLVIAELVIYSVGFFGLLYSAYTLVLDRERMVGRGKPLPGPISFLITIISNRTIIRVALTAAVALGVAAGSMLDSSQQSTLNTANSLRKASIYIFLAVSACLVLVASHLAYEEIHGVPRRFCRLMFAYMRSAGPTNHDAPVGRRYRIFVLLAIAFLCLAREAFYAATANDVVRQDNPRLWYPLSALTELLAVLLFAVPGLVPSRREITEADEQLKATDLDSDLELHRGGRSA